VRKPPSLSRDRILEPEERDLIIRSIRDQAFRDFVTALQHGARPGEVRCVTAADVDLKHGVWILPKHKTAKKTNEPRIIYLTPQMVELTRALMLKNPEGPLFLNRNGKPWTKSAICLRYRRLRQKFPQLKDVVAYTNRHTFGTDALERGVPDADVAALMGHKGTDMLHSVYSKLRKKYEHLRQAAEKAIGPTTDAGQPGC